MTSSDKLDPKDMSLAAPGTVDVILLLRFGIAFVILFAFGCLIIVYEVFEAQRIPRYSSLQEPDLSALSLIHI